VGSLQWVGGAVAGRADQRSLPGAHRAVEHETIASPPFAAAPASRSSAASPSRSCR